MFIEDYSYVVIWGNNPIVANSDGTLGHWIVECMKRGTKLITIDPKKCGVAARRVLEWKGKDGDRPRLAACTLT